MRLRLLVTIVSIALTGCGSPNSDTGQQAPEPGGGGKADVFGDDDRFDLYEFDGDSDDGDDAMLLAAARSTAMFVANHKLEPTAGGYRATLRSLGEAKDLCEDVQFAEQPRLGNCTGFLVAPDVLATAGHCLGFDDGEAEEYCTKNKIVFDWAYFDPPSGGDWMAPMEFIAEDDVFSCVEVIAIGTRTCFDDWALVRLDREVPRPPVRVRNADERGARPGDELFVTGHPFSIPMKIGTNGIAIESEEDLPDQLMAHRLDTFGGNSGSPIFNRQDGVVEAIHVCRASEEHLQWDDQRQCNVYEQCDDDGEPDGEVDSCGYDDEPRGFRVQEIEPLQDIVEL
jgi:hypothetical protein